MTDKSEAWPATADRNLIAAFSSGAIIGTLGGLIGLGGAEFRLPLLISLFRLRGLDAVILNKATSLIVVARPAVPRCDGAVYRDRSALARDR
jgi:uncharacterized protein